jgi:hypothetical protein
MPNLAKIKKERLKMISELVSGSISKNDWVVGVRHDQQTIIDNQHDRETKHMPQPRQLRRQHEETSAGMYKKGNHINHTRQTHVGANE